jgi:3-oxoacyl-[acyl-carrier-protein] synthase II
MVQNCEVVITGIGVVSPIGIGKQAYWDAMLNGRSGIAPLSFAEGTDFPVKFGGEIRDFDAKQFVKPRKSLKVMCREIQAGYSAAMLAIQDAGITKGALDPDRYGVVLGSEMFYCDLAEVADAYRKCIVDGQLQTERWGERAMSDLYPLWMLKYLPNMVACHLAIAEDARGPNNTITLDEVSSLLALQEAVQVIQRGAADAMLTGGTGTRVNLTRILYRGDSRWSHRHDAPAAACRPFDADRDGGVIGEGAAAFLLERREHAEARGATILARVLACSAGFGRKANAYYPTRDAVEISLRHALDQAGLAPGDIGHVNAQGSSMPDPDRVEAQAIRNVLGDCAVTAPRSFFGCLGSGSGAVEMVASVQALAEGVVPPTLNFETPDPECPVNVIHGDPQPVERPFAMLLNQAETGQAVAAILAAP